MASRRLRVKLAPNLGLSRNKSKPEHPKPKLRVVVKSDTDNSDAEAISDLDVPLIKNVNISNELTKSVVQIEKPTNSNVGERNVNTIESNNSTIDEPCTDKPIVINNDENEIPVKPLVESSLTATSTSPSTLYNVVSQPAPILPLETGIDALETKDASDWEDDQFTYNSVSVDRNDEIYKSLEITPIVSPALTTATSPQPNQGSQKIRLPIGKNKFKPNLNFDRRSRNTSGGGVISPRPVVSNGFSQPRPRTISGSSTSSEPEVLPGRPPLPPSPLLREAISAPRTTKPARVRRNTEGRSVGERSQFMRRKLEHKRKFTRGVPDRGNMTMFDLIYYNPEYGQRMSVEDDDEKEVDNPDDPNSNDNQKVPDSLDDSVTPSEPTTPDRASPEEDSLPVPQVKVGVNGEIIIDEASLQLETTEQKKAKDLLQNSPVVFENNKTSTNYGTWSKKRRHSDWSERETLRFYRALSVVGSDFSMMESIFKNRTRQELKLKFKKEEKLNNKMIDKCLRERGMYTDLEGLMEDSEEETEEEKEREKRSKKKRPRRRYKNRGYYDSSSGGEDADVETSSRSPVRKRVRGNSKEERQVVRIKRPQVMHRENAMAMVPNKSIRPLHPRPEAVSLSQLAVQAQQSGMSGVQLTNVPMSGVQFPPGLLAANPGLVGAKPGSLVVVASPNKSDPTSQLLHVYMVSAKNKEKMSRERSSSPRSAGSPCSTPSSRLTLDPAVVRAVDRTRLVERARTMSECGTGKVQARVRTVSETEDSRTVQSQVLPRTRQRTYSESGLSVRGQDLRTEIIRQRFLSGSAKSFPGVSTLIRPIIPPVQPTTALLPVAKKSKPEVMVDLVGTS